MAKRRAKEKPVKQQRLCELIIIWGRNGTGKSTLAKQLIYSSNGRKILVTKSGAPRIWHDVPVMDVTNKKHFVFKNKTRQVILRFRDDHPDSGKNDAFLQLYKNYKDGYLILDDCKQYFSSNTENVPGLIDLLIEYRHSMIDLFVIVHGPDQLPPKIWDHASGVIVMAASRLLKNTARIEAFDDIIAAQKRVNRKFKIAEAKGGDGQYGIHEYIRL